MRLARDWRPRDPRYRAAVTTTARSLAVAALTRIDEGAYANVVVPEMLDACELAARDRAFVTELVYGTTRMRRACDWMVDRAVDRDVEPEVRNALRIGAYQLAFLGTPPHAAVSATVDAAPARARGLVNAVLRRLSAALPPHWPDPPTKLSYPDWIVRRLAADIGADAATAALEKMNEAASVTERPDGYVQDLASQWVAAAVDAQPGLRVVDLCAAPGGKATAMAAAGPRIVVGADVRRDRARRLAANIDALRLRNVATVVADGRAAPVRPAAWDRVLVDAPCSGLGVLRRRPDARWRIDSDGVTRLAQLQRELVAEARRLLAPGGVLVYSVCTMTAAETLDVDSWLAAAHPDLTALAPPGPPWQGHGRGGLLLPQAADTDGMFLLRLRAPV